MPALKHPKVPAKRTRGRSTLCNERKGDKRHTKKPVGRTEPCTALLWCSTCGRKQEAHVELQFHTRSSSWPDSGSPSFCVLFRPSLLLHPSFSSSCFVFFNPNQTAAKAGRKLSQTKPEATGNATEVQISSMRVWYFGCVDCVRSTDFCHCRKQLRCTHWPLPLHSCVLLG